MNEIPKHVGIIMDGNGRWAENQNMERWQGHLAGAENIEPILYHAMNLGIETLTVYALSLDNIKKRFDEEKQHLFSIFNAKLDYAKKKFHDKNMKLRFIGNLAYLPNDIQEKAQQVAEMTTNNDRGTFVMAMAYNGQDEIKRAVSNALKEGSDDFTKHMDSYDFSPVDLIIRTGVENPIITRLSDFLLWQSAYAEIYSTSKYWPDFTVADFDFALDQYFESERKYGAVLMRKDWGGY